LLLTKNVTLKWTKSNKKYYINHGYNFTNIGDEFIVDINDIHFPLDNFELEYQCDDPNCSKIINVNSKQYALIKLESIYCKECKWKYYNQYINKGDYFELKTNNSEVVFKIDKEKVDWAKQFIWSTTERILNDKTYHYITTKIKRDGEWRRIKYHMEIMKDKINTYKEEHKDYIKQIIVDHINGDTTDNRETNLRVRTQSENNMNKEMQSNNTSGIIGVGWHSRDKIWEVRIGYKEETIHIGRFYYLRNAVRARMEYENKLFGEHALKERENNDYKEYIDYILSLPPIEEPIFMKRPNNEFNMLGIRRNNRGKTPRYTASICIKENNYNKISKTFDLLEDAIRWRKEKEVEIYGKEITYSDEKQEKLI
jgi:hypothetical protein